MLKGKTLGVKSSNFIVYLICLVAGFVLVGIAIILYVTKQDSFVVNLLVGLGCSALPTALTAYFIDSLTDKRNLDRVRRLRNDNLWTVPHCFYRISKIIVERYSTGDSKDKSLIQCVKDSFAALKVRHFDSENEYDKFAELGDLLDDLSDIFRLCKNDTNEILRDKHTFQTEGIFSNDELIVLRETEEDCTRIMMESNLKEALESIGIMIERAYGGIDEIKNKLDGIAEIEGGHLKNASNF